MPAVLFIVDGSLDRPLLHSQGLPLLRRLAGRGIRCFILSFESTLDWLETPLARNLAAHGIKWHSLILAPTASVLQRIQMILQGFWLAFQLCRREHIEIVHCRSYRPGMIGGLLKLLAGQGFIFDMRGFLIDEQVVLGRWQKTTLKYRLAKIWERRMILQADAIVTTSNPFRDLVLQLPYYPPQDSVRVFTIPNCVDTQRFGVPDEVRDAVRSNLGWQNRIVLAFVGEVSKWENFECIARLYKLAKSIDMRVFLALFVYGDIDALRVTLSEHEINADADYRIMTLPAQEMPRHLGAADIGIVLRVANTFTNTIASPVKFGEYLASGLPVIINAGMGDTEKIVNTYNVGVIVDPDNENSLQKSAQDILSLVGEPDIRRRCREAAEQEISLDLAVERYSRIYDSVATIASRRVRTSE